MAKISEMDERFVAHLEKLRDADDRAALARLRRGLGKPPGTVPEMHALVLPWLPQDIPRWHEDQCYLIAALFASHPQAGGQGSLGKSFGLLRDKSEGKESVERRFVALLNCHEEELPDHLRHAISLLKSKEIPVDWRELLNDLHHWGHSDRRVQRKWARDFWTATLADTAPPAPKVAQSVNEAM